MTSAGEDLVDILKYQKALRWANLKLEIWSYTARIKALLAPNDPKANRMKQPPVNRATPDQWKTDIAASVDLYNDWFMRFAPATFREARVRATKHVEDALAKTANLTDIKPETLAANPGVLPTLRMATCPPLARDRLIGLAGVSKNLVQRMEEGKMPSRLGAAGAAQDLKKISSIIRQMADPDIFVWLERHEPATKEEIHRAATIVADRLCGAVADPIVRNAQEKRQLDLIGNWLDERGYKKLDPGQGTKFDAMKPGTYSFRMNVPVEQPGAGKTVNMPIDVVIMPKAAVAKELPLLLEAKSAGDFTNVNKRRKEEAQKMTQLLSTYGSQVRFALFLCGYFDTGYLGYEAAEGIDWVWEHRIDDLALFGV